MKVSLSTKSMPHQPYFSRLQKQLQQNGYGRPRLVVDLDRIDHNLTSLESLVDPSKVRLVVKSLPCLELLAYINERLASNRFMVFQESDIVPVLKRFCDGQILMGKPLPVQCFQKILDDISGDTALKQIFEKQVLWLIDTKSRFEQYLDVAKKLNIKFSYVVEIEIGMRRGGISSRNELEGIIDHESNKDLIATFSGFMGYDAHLPKGPFPGSSANAFSNATSKYRDFIAWARNVIPQVISSEKESEWVLNGAGSLTFHLYKSSSTLNDFSLGSALVKPGQFCSDSLSKFLTAAYIAAPVLKVMPGTSIPYIRLLSWIWSKISPKRRMSYFIYGGYWKAQPVSPTGLSYNPLWGRSSNQEFLNGGSNSNLKVDDIVFYLPDQSEEVLRGFGDLYVVRSDKFVGNWPVL